MGLRSDPLTPGQTYGSAAATVGVTAAAIGGQYKLGCILYNNGSATIFLGGPDVTVDNGLLLKPGATVSDERFQDLTKLYAISGSAGQDLRVFGFKS